MMSDKSCKFANKNDFMREYEHNGIRELPYSVQDFVAIVEQNLYYVDKTMYIPKLEGQARNLFFIRPRCFGKSVFLGMPMPSGKHAHKRMQTVISDIWLFFFKQISEMIFFFSNNYCIFAA